MADYLVDTNVLVYALDESDLPRQARAVTWLDHLLTTDSGALSAQALTEVANVCLHRLAPRWQVDRVSDHVQALARAFHVLPVTPAVVVEALRGVGQYQLSYFDAQMWAVARLHQIPALLSENMASGASLDGVLIVDPFTTETPMIR